MTAGKEAKPLWQRLFVYLILSVGILLLACPRCFVNLGSDIIWAGLFSFLLFTTLAEGNGFLMRWFNRVYPWESNPKRRFYLSLLVILCFSIPMILLINVIFFVWVWGQPLSSFTSKQFYNTLVLSSMITIIISLFLFSLEFLDKWQELAEVQEQKKNKALYAQIESLQNQIKPHFLFNNLNAVTSIIPDDPDTAIKFINQLSKVYRYILDHQHDELVDVVTELEFARSYAFLSGIRYGEKLNFDWQVEQLQGSLPPYTLQLLIENAIKHNVISRHKPLSISLRAEQGKLIVRNNLQVKEAEGASWGIGLNNIKERYALLSQEQVSVQETEAEFIVVVPLLNLKST